MTTTIYPLAVIEGMCTLIRRCMELRNKTTTIPENYRHNQLKWSRAQRSEQQRKDAEHGTQMRTHTRTQRVHRHTHTHTHTHKITHTHTHTHTHTQTHTHTRTHTHTVTHSHRHTHTHTHRHTHHTHTHTHMHARTHARHTVRYISSSLSR